MENDSVSIEAIVDRVAETLGGGGTLGSLFAYDEKDYEAVYALGHELYAQARYGDAMKAFSFLVMNNPFEHRFVNAYASALQMQKRHEDAISFYSLASVMDIVDPQPTFHTAECLLALGRMKEAVDALNIVVGQCKAPEQEALKVRAQGMLDIMKRPQTTERNAST